MTTIVRLASLFVFFGVIAGVFYFTRADQLGLKGEVFDSRGYLLICCVLLVGIVFGSVYRRIMAVEGEQMAIGKECLAAFNSKSFWSAILVSPFLFGSVYTFLQTRPDDVVAFLFAFENGFFCESVFKEFHARRERAAARET